MNRADILDDCLTRIRAGESLADCLESYPEYADELALSVDAAGQVGVLAAARLPESARVQAKTSLRRALAERSPQSFQPGRFTGLFGILSGNNWLSRARVLALACSVAVVVVLAGMATAVAASGPGDLPYGVRVLVEQVPVLLRPGAEARADADLSFAGRRLADLQEYLMSTGRIDTRALEALMAADASAMRASTGLAPDRRAVIASTVRAHATALRALAAEAHAATVSGALQHAADEVDTPDSKAEPEEPSKVPSSVMSPSPLPAPPQAEVAPERAPAGPAPMDDPSVKAESLTRRATPVVDTEPDIPEVFSDRQKSVETPVASGSDLGPSVPPAQDKDSHQPPAVGRDKPQPGKDAWVPPGLSKSAPKAPPARSQGQGQGQGKGQDKNKNQNQNQKGSASSGAEPDAATPRKNH